MVRTIASLVLSLGSVAIGVCLAAGAETPPRLAARLLDIAEFQYRIEREHIQDPLGRRKVADFQAPRLQHLQRLREDWSSTIGTPPHALPAAAKAIHETFQFYLGGRTNFEAADRETLLNPRLPIKLEGTNISLADREAFEPGAIRLRIAWLSLSTQFDLSDVLPIDRQLICAFLPLQYINELSRSNRCIALSATDLDIIAEAAHRELAVLKPDFIENLLNANPPESRNQTADMVSNTDAWKTSCRNIPKYFNGGLQLLFRSFLDSNPAALESRVFAMERWVCAQVRDESAILQLVKDSTEPRREFFTNCASTLALVMEALGGGTANSASAAEAASSDAPLTSDEITYVDELLTFLCPGNHARLDCGDARARYVEALAAGDWQAIMSGKFCDPSQNLRDAVRFCQSYLRRYESDRTKSRLEQIRKSLTVLYENAISLRDAK